MPYRKANHKKKVGALTLPSRYQCNFVFFVKKKLAVDSTFLSYCSDYRPCIFFSFASIYLIIVTLSKVFSSQMFASVKSKLRWLHMVQIKDCARSRCPCGNDLRKSILNPRATEEETKALTRKFKACSQHAKKTPSTFTP